MNIEDALRDMKLSIHEVQARLDKVERNSHPPIFKEGTYEELDARLQVIEAFYNSIKLITTNKEELE